MSAIDVMSQQYAEIQQLKYHRDGLMQSLRACEQRAAALEAQLRAEVNHSAAIAREVEAERDIHRDYRLRAETQVQAVRAFCKSARFSIVQVRDVLALVDAAPATKDAP